MRQVAVLVIVVLALLGCGRDDAGAFCAAAEDLRIAHAEVFALVLEEGEPRLEDIRASTERGAALSRRLAEVAPEDAIRGDYELIAEYQQQGAEHFASMASPDEALPAPADEATTQAFERTEAYVLEECGIDLWPQV